MLDISSVEVNHTASALTFKISLMGDPVATTWGEYLIGGLGGLVMLCRLGKRRV